MNLECHPTYESIEAHLNTASIRFSRDAVSPEPSSITEDHLLVCETCQEVAESELTLASLIRRILVANDRR